MTDTVMELVLDDYKVAWEDLGEGLYGDYDPENANDTAMLRFDVYRMVSGEWEPMEDASYCTMMPTDTPKETLQAGLEAIMGAVYGKESVSRICDELSWMAPSWFD